MKIFPPCYIPVLCRPGAIGVTGRLRRRRPLSTGEFTYLKSRTRKIAKVTLPSPGLFANFYVPGGSDAAHGSPYGSIWDFLGDVARILRDEVVALARLGATYIQLDAPHYALLLDPRTRGFYEQRGWSVDQWLDLGIELDNRVMAPIPGVTFALAIIPGMSHPSVQWSSTALKPNSPLNRSAVSMSSRDRKSVV